MPKYKVVHTLLQEYEVYAKDKEEAIKKIIVGLSAENVIYRPRPEKDEEDWSVEKIKEVDDAKV